MNDFFEDFKPIRNTFKKLNIWDILYELKRIPRGRYVPEITEFIYLNSIVYSMDNKNVRAKNPQKEWQKIITHSIALHEKVDSFWIDNNVWGFLQKLALNQLKATPNHQFNHLYRYFYIFSNDQLVEHVDNMLGMSYRDFFTCSFWIYSVFEKKSYWVEKPYFFQEKNENTTFSEKNMSKTLSILSTGLSELREQLKQQLKYDSNTFITHDYEHVKKPIFEFNQNLYCLIPDLLFNQFTSGVYYLAEIYDNKYKLNNAFGSCFEQYVGIVLNKNQRDKMKITKELKYNRGQNKTSDWIIESNETIVFIECKTKRLQMQSKKYEDINRSDFNSIVEAVFQTYQVYNFYKNGKIKDLEYNPKKFFIPIIITLEEWYAGIPDLNEEIKTTVKDRLKSASINNDIVEKFKFYITSISNFEMDIQIMTKVGFREYYDGIRSGEIKKDEFKFESYFKEEIENEILKPLEKQIQRNSL